MGHKEMQISYHYQSYRRRIFPPFFTADFDNKGIEMALTR
jgi:hypothetical protein